METGNTPNILEGLNESQYNAVTHETGPSLVIAGAGSGKTRVLTYRIAHLLDRQRVRPYQMLALTFTNKASREMRKRIESLIGGQAREIVMGTFHSVFSRILRVEANRVGYTSSFTIYDEEDATGLIKSILRELKIDDKKYKPRSLKHYISGAKNHLINAEKFRAQYVNDTFTEIAAQVFHHYEIRCQRANAMDFDDLLTNMVRLLEDSPEMLHKYQHRFQQILVDEYQDTNHAQYIITRKLAAAHENICVVGDDAQSIYSFRGATIDNILNFQRDYPDAVLYKLEHNYRSTETIVNLANSIIANNERQIEKNVFTRNESGELIRLHEANTDLEEADKVVDAIREQKAFFSLRNQDIALLYRTNAQSRPLEDALRRKNIAYRIYGGLSFYNRKEVKDVVAYLRLAVNPDDEEALKRIINYPTRGIGATSLEKLARFAADQGISLWQALPHAKALKLGRTAAAIEQFVALIQKMQQVAHQGTAAEAVEQITRDSGILRDLNQDPTQENRSRMENVQELQSAAEEFTADESREDVSLFAYLAEIALYTDQDKDTDGDQVTLMTVHAAKGLEFPSVFVVGLEDGLFPSSMAMNTKAEIEEERRLFYVAVTRAEKLLTLSYARSRYRYGGPQSMEPSRFLDEIDRSFIKSLSQHHRETRNAQPAPRQVQPRRVKRVDSVASSQPARSGGAGSPPPQGDDLTQLEAGMEVFHAKFGRGRVLSIDDKGGSDRRAEVDFREKGRKTLILKYARLKILNPS